MQWWVIWSFSGVTYKQFGSEADAQAWARKTYGEGDYLFGGPNINPLAPTGFLGSQNTALIFGPFASKAAAQQAAKTGQLPAGAGAAGSGGQNIANDIPGLAAIGDFFSRLTEGNTWLRLGEGLLGLILIAVGIARLTHSVPLATSIARTAGAAA